MYLQPSTWRALGLSVGVGYAVLGAAAIGWPREWGAQIFGVASSPDRSDAKTTSFASQDASDAEILMPLIGARDLSIAAAIFVLARENQHHKALGTVILSGMILSLADVVVVWKRRGWQMWVRGAESADARGALMALGADIWGLIGMGLVLDCV